jgi:hypothetical protein
MRFEPPSIEGAIQQTSYKNGATDKQAKPLSDAFMQGRSHALLETVGTLQQSGRAEKIGRTSFEMMLNAAATTRPYR